MSREGTTVLACTCTAPDQDKLYGKGQRLHNLGFAKGKANDKAYCTVCSANNRTVRISFVFPKPNQFGPLDKDPTIKRIVKFAGSSKKSLAAITK